MLLIGWKAPTVVTEAALDHAMRIDYIRNVIELIDLVLRGSTIKDAAAEVGMVYHSAVKICSVAGVSSREAASKKKSEAKRGEINSAARRYSDPEERERARARAAISWSKRTRKSSPPER